MTDSEKILRSLVIPLRDLLEERGIAWDLDLLTRVLLDPKWILNRIAALRAHEVDHLQIGAEQIITLSVRERKKLGNGRIFWANSNCCSSMGPVVGYHSRRCEVAAELRDTCGLAEVQRQADAARALALLLGPDEMDRVAERKAERVRQEALRTEAMQSASDRTNALLQMREALQARGVDVGEIGDNVIEVEDGRLSTGFLAALRSATNRPILYWISFQEVLATTGSLATPEGYYPCRRCNTFYPNGMLHHCGSGNGYGDSPTHSPE